jgi:hypothetical protein
MCLNKSGGEAMPRIIGYLLVALVEVTIGTAAYGSSKTSTIVVFEALDTAIVVNCGDIIIQRQKLLNYSAEELGNCEIFKENVINDLTKLSADQIERNELLVAIPLQKRFFVTFGEVNLMSKSELQPSDC